MIVRFCRRNLTGGQSGLTLISSILLLWTPAGIPLVRVSTVVAPDGAGLEAVLPRYLVSVFVVTVVL